MTKAEVFESVQQEVKEALERLGKVVVILENAELVQKANTMNNIIGKIESWQGKVTYEDEL